MFIPLRTALLIDFSGAAISFGAMLAFAYVNRPASALGFFMAFVAFILSAYVQKNRAEGNPAAGAELGMAFLAVLACITLVFALVSWLLEVPA